MTIPFLRRLGRALLLGALTALPLTAQATAVVLGDGAFDVTLLTHASSAPADGDARMAEYFRACRQRLALPAADSSAVARSRPWDWTLGGTADPGTLTVLVSRSTRDEVSCQAPASLRALAYLRGFRVTSDTLYPYDAAITGVAVVRDSQLIMPVDGERVALTRITQRGLVTVSGAIVRISVPIDGLVPDSLGEVHDLRIAITTPELEQPHLVRIPWWALRPIWRQLLVARARALPGARSAADSAILLRTDAPTLSEPQRLEARVRLGTAFAEAGDLGAARMLLAEAVGAEPCLTLAPAASTPARTIVSQVRRAKARCVANMPLTVGRALAIPGFGHFDTPRRRVTSVATLLAVAGTLAASQSTNDEAKRLYAEYRAFDSTVPNEASTNAALLYDRAEDKRAFGTTLVVLGAVMWGASVVEAAWAEHRQEQRLARVRDVDARAPRVGFAPHAAPGRLGLALTLPARETAR